MKRATSTAPGDGSLHWKWGISGVVTRAPGSCKGSLK